MTSVSFVKQSGISRGAARVYLVGIPFFAALQGYARAQVKRRRQSKSERQRPN
jgi:hypothetical protein